MMTLKGNFAVTLNSMIADTLSLMDTRVVAKPRTSNLASLPTFTLVTGDGDTVRLSSRASNIWMKLNNAPVFHIMRRSGRLLIKERVVNKESLRSDIAHNLVSDLA